MITVVLCYLLALAAAVAVSVVLRFRSFKSQRRQHAFTFSADENESVDQKVDDLAIERAESMVSTQALSKRGSWRVALDQVMSLTDFEEMKAEEYQKML